MIRKSIAAVKARIPKPVKLAYISTRTRLKSFLRVFGFTTARRRVRGLDLKIGVSSDLEQYRADSYATKEPETLDWLDENLRDDDVLLDIGANIGLYSLYAAKLRPKCAVYAVEPEAQNFCRLCRNILLNSAKNITPCNFPLSDREAFGTFYVSEQQAGSALNSFGQPSDMRPEAAVALKQGALSTTLDALVERLRFPPPTLIKLDVDGLEEAILRGAQGILKSGRVRGLLVELNLPSGDGAAPSPALAQLKDCGYVLTRKGEWVWESRGIKSQNFIFKLAR